MKKLKLKALASGATEILSRDQMKTILGGRMGTPCPAMIPCLFDGDCYGNSCYRCNRGTTWGICEYGVEV